MTLFIFMIVLFVLGYLAIALEHTIKVDKAASALILSVLMWTVFMLGAHDILSLGFSDAWDHFLHSTELQDVLAAHPDFTISQQMHEFIVDNQIIRHVGEISEILFFLLGAMTIVETIDQHQGFRLLTDKITTTNQVKLIWILSVLTFFMSALLDNLTTTIVMVALLRKLIDDKHTRWFFASMVVIAANAGGAWSPIGDVTTIMLWIGGQVTAANIVVKVFLPSVFNMVIPLIVVSFMMKGKSIERPADNVAGSEGLASESEAKFVLIMGVLVLLFVPIFKTLTHLPPYMGMLFGLGVMWFVTEFMHKNKPEEVKGNLKVYGILKKVDVPTVFFFLGILSAVAALQSAGHLGLLAKFLDENIHDVYAINSVIGVLSAIVDNVPLTSAAMGMYDIQTPAMLSTVDPANHAYMEHFIQDGTFWELLAYCAGTGGSILIIGSAAGVAAMGLEKIDFIWYMKRISLLAALGYFAGVACYYVQETMLLKFM
jgi:Na+/H+ antiporter NhaD/arsenite permease-like protein